MPDVPQSTPGDPDIEAWTRAAAGGDVEALEALFVVTHDRLLGLARRKVGVDWQGKIDPDDILQEAYIAAFNGLASFEPEGDDAFYRWTAAIIDHRFIDAVRRLRRQKRDVTRQRRMPSRLSRHESLMGQLREGAGAPSRIVRTQDAIGSLMSCIARLPEAQRVAVQRLHLDEASLADVARELDRSEEATRQLARRGLEKLRELMGRRSRYLSSGE